MLFYLPSRSSFNQIPYIFILGNLLSVLLP
nr:MAG TPA: hypothetical protein [Caudoviricetes sp.]